MEQMKSLEQAILHELKELGDTLPADLPKSIFGFASFFVNKLTADQLEEMYEIEEELGEEAANEWLVGVLVKSGFYEDVGGGHIQLKQSE